MATSSSHHADHPAEQPATEEAVEPGPAAPDPSEQARRPPGLLQSPQRLQGRRYEDAWGTFPPEEIDATNAPGAGPYGSIGTGGLYRPMLPLGVGFAMIFLTFFTAHWIPLVLGLLLMAGGAAWILFGTDHPGSMKGAGTSKVKARNLKR